MYTGSRTFRLATVSLACAASAAGLVALAAPAGAVTSDATAYLANLNQERADHGLAPLTMRSDLNSIAQSWSNHMASVSVLSHNPNLANAVSNWQVVGENVGEGPSISSLTTAFWNSAPHRDNILDGEYRDVGIATTNSSDGTIWITVDFRDPMSSESSSTVAAPTSSSTTSGAHVANSHPTLRIGSRGSAVRRVQRHLHVTADGIFGRHTRRAVVRFQRHHHLRANGIVGRRTWRALHA
jgi:hypothetical protein